MTVTPPAAWRMAPLLMAGRLGRPVTWTLHQFDLARRPRRSTSGNTWEPAWFSLHPRARALCLCVIWLDFHAIAQLSIGLQTIAANHSAAAPQISSSGCLLGRAHSPFSLCVVGQEDHRCAHPLASVGPYDTSCGQPFASQSAPRRLGGLARLKYQSTAHATRRLPHVFRIAAGPCPATLCQRDLTLQPTKGNNLQ
ncbi:hypothetical protein DENSPDRAFT_65443 [Dentipellis sp. KUC8613]|nr:hypothetical protein DENSPDRAFT_65443 [Dentipellis sp. KUC8613]